MRDGLAWVFGSALQSEGLGSVEGGGCADFAGFLGVDLGRLLGGGFRLNGHKGDSLLGVWPLRLDLLWRRAFWAWSLGAS
jgi:hypothetical protein